MTDSPKYDHLGFNFLRRFLSFGILKTSQITLKMIEDKKFIFNNREISAHLSYSGKI